MVTANVRTPALPASCNSKIRPLRNVCFQRCRRGTFQAAAAIRTSAYAMTQFAVSQSFGNAKRVKDLDESHR
jgi:hypothetical protein